MIGKTALRDRIEYLKDPFLVWRFQEYFGVEKVRKVENRKGSSYKAVDVTTPDFIRDNGRRLAVSSSSEEDLLARSSSSSSLEARDEEDGNVLYYRINSWLWYYIFLLGTQLGDETYYSIFFCFWFWNIDGAVGRRVILVWNLVMYIGQGMKDVVRWERPSMPPVIQLETKWALEYGMPSTHAMVGLAVPTSIIIFTMGRYQYPFFLWASIAFIWCFLVCTSRIYLGMHSLADIYVGLAFASFLLLFVIPIADLLDYFLLSHPLAPLLTIALSVAGVLFYPGSDRWTPARGDTTVILGSYLGTQLGVWANFQLGILKGPPLPPPYPILWPTYEQYGETLLRMMVGGVVIIATRALCKPTVYFMTSKLLGTDVRTLKQQKNDVANKKKLVAELTTKFLTYLAVGFNCLFTVPTVFRAIGCERATFHTEV